MSNFILIMSDEHNPRFTSPYGHNTVITPNMQAMAEDGVLFESAYCPSPLCMPSRSAFMAGRRAHDLQTYSNCNLRVDASPESYGAALARQDVHAVHIGKTDVYAPGKELGFSEIIRPIDRSRPGDTNHRRNPMSIREGAAQRADGFGPREDAGAQDALCVDDAVKWLRESAQNVAEPWVLVVQVTHPHFPHIAPPEFWEMYGEQDLPAHGECASANHPYAIAIRRHFETEHFSDEQIRGLIRGYLACVSLVDHQLGRVLDTVEELGMNNTTNVAYTSDHGDMLGKFGMWWKCSLYEDAVRVPMIVRGPDFPTHVRVQTPVDLHDLRAAMFAATGASQPEGWVGQPLQTIAPDDSKRIVFSEYHGHGTPGSSYMIRQGPWKYLHHATAPCQLFNLDNDPEELDDIAPTNPDIVARLDAELRKICAPEHENDRAEQFINRQLEDLEIMGEQTNV